VSSHAPAVFLGSRRNHGAHAREDTTMTMRLRELTLRYSAVNDAGGSPLLVGKTIERPSDAAPALVSLLQHEAVEVFVVLCLSTKRRVLGYYEVSRGTLDSTLVHPRDVFKVAVLANAAAIIAAHNHPSGDPSPTREDLAVTRRLVSAGEILGIEVLDHIVIGDEGWVSLHGAKLIP
jgi:DNA repair protein RadC